MRPIKSKANTTRYSMPRKDTDLQREIEAVRKIAFRAWDGINKRMYYAFQVDSQGNGIGQIALPMGQVWEGSHIGKDSDIILMQFTGLHDKNGKEIWEGDIIRPVDMHDSNIDQWMRCEATKEYPYTSIGKPYEVKWWNHGWDVPCDPEYWEVLGNIYSGLLPEYEKPDMIKTWTEITNKPYPKR